MKKENDVTTENMEMGGPSLSNHDLSDFTPLQTEVPFSSADYRIEYVSWRSIESRTGIGKSDAYKFVVKEILDNAVDFIETAGIWSSAPEIKVTIKSNETNPRIFSILIRNSNPDYKPIARGNSKQMLKSIFTIGKYYSSKRNIFRITKGALGDALKEILCIPFALADDQQIKWTEPLIIRNSNKEFKIRLIVDKLTDNIETDIEESFCDISGVTEVEVTYLL
jgi:hypothetical protein